MPSKTSARNILLLALTTLLIYANVLNAPFHFDDLSLMLANPHIRSFQGVFSDLGTDQRKYLTFLTFAVNFRIHPYNPFWYRIVNIMLHCLTAVFLASALKYLFQAPFFQKNKQPHTGFLAWGTALLFCVHPLQTDSVTYIWQRSEVLSGLFYALVLWCYWRGRVTKNRIFLAGAAGFLFTGLYAKGSVMTAPILIGISEVMFFRTGKYVIRHYAALIGIFLLLIAGALTMDKVLFQVDFFADRRYLHTQFLVIWKYLQLTFFPIGQSVDHGYTWAQSFWQPGVLLGFSGLAAIFAVMTALSRRYRLACFGAAWFFIYLIPTSTFIQLLTPIFEHRLYFSLAGFGLFLTDIILRLAKNRIKTARLVLMVILCIFCVLTAARNQVWKTQNGLFEDAVRKSPDYIRPRFVLGSYYLSQGRFDDAQRLFRECIKMNPNLANAINSLAVILERQGREQEAVRLYKRAVEKDPGCHDPYLNLAKYYYRKGRLEKAWHWISRALSRHPDHRVYAYAAFLQMKAGRFDKAKKLLNKGFSENAASARLLYSQGMWYLHQEKFIQAAASLESAAKYAPQWVSPVNDLGVVYFMLKRYESARDALERAHRLSPRDAGIYLNLANVYHELGEHDKARRYYETSQYKGLLKYIPANFDGKDILLLGQDAP